MVKRLGRIFGSGIAYSSQLSCVAHGVSSNLFRRDLVKSIAGRRMTSAASPPGALAVHVYLSEGRDADLISRFVGSAEVPGVLVTDTFIDNAYHRVGITLASLEFSCLESSIAAICRETLSALDLRRHQASHPRLGVVDHICCNPLGSLSLAEAGQFARSVAAELGKGLAANATAPAAPAVPVYLYGTAHDGQRSLAELRRQLAYFKGANTGEWSGLAPEVVAAVHALPGEFGPPEVDPRLGVTVVGAVPWVTNYNLLLTSSAASLEQAELMKRCQRVARATSARGGGLVAVETMALPHENGVEVACNLLDESVSPAAVVKAKVLELCGAEGLEVRDDYFTKKGPEQILALLTTSQ